MSVLVVLVLTVATVSPATVSPAVTVATPVATQLLSAMYGSLQSPNFPEPYPPHSSLRWNITVAPGYRLRLYFSHFHLEPSYLCQYDYVQIEADGELLGLFCGLDPTDTEAVPSQIISSPRNSLSLFFCSDFSNEERYPGFLAHYSTEDVDECSEQSDEELVCDHFCHNFIGGYYCSCRYGYLLHHDNRTCRGKPPVAMVTCCTMTTAPAEVM
ncbi:mannan-binding lectin serine protease 1-like [Perca fluviatilis]|uniref:mannan-binding lectin serine protease 1-like n=1 Tax=Perca fluviatilis TaxID=8168 RepID=UPI001965A126|nr:mannan-binding lectin serine protease 1-like [Perca fluviatilis]